MNQTGNQRQPYNTGNMVRDIDGDDTHGGSTAEQKEGGSSTAKEQEDTGSCSAVPTRRDGCVLLSHVSTGTTAHASSVLQKNVKLYGPMNALNCDDALTCWNSEGNRHDSSSTGKKAMKHSFVVNFNRPVVPIELCIQFQAGFVAEEMTVLWKKEKKDVGGGDDDGDGDNDQVAVQEEWVEVDEYEVDDDHDIQSFPLQQQPTSGTDKHNHQQQHQLVTITTSIKLLFDECTDFFDRVTIYKLQVWGTEVLS